MLIVAITITHGQVNSTLFLGADNAVDMVVEHSFDTHKTAQTTPEREKCCKEHPAPKPVKVSYCHLDCGLILSQIAVHGPPSRKLFQLSAGSVSIQNQPEMQLRPPIV